MKLRKLFAVLIVFLMVIGLAKVIIRAAEVDVSNETELRNAVNSATEATVINLINDISLSGDFIIPVGKVITLRSATGGPYKLLGADNYDTITVDGILTIDGVIVTHPAGAYGGGILVGSGTASIPPGLNGTLYLESGSISGNYNFVGGGVYNNTGTFYMNGGSISDNRADIFGGGVVNASRAIFYLNGGTITNNSADETGGGVTTAGAFYMNGGSITHNTAAYDGGGVEASTSGYGSINITNGTIANNTASNRGGGIYTNGPTITMSGGVIENNQAVTGGGIYLKDAIVLGITYNAELNTSGTAIIRNNTATTTIPGFGGGGIHVNNNNYTRLNIGASTVFSGNTATSLSMPPYNIATIYPNIAATSQSASFHPLNNYDINYVEVTVTISYDANGGVGGRSFSGGARILNIADSTEANVSYAGYTLAGWNTVADGSGTPYTIGQTITLNSNLRLYAQWEQIPTATITYDANGGVGGQSFSGVMARTITIAGSTEADVSYAGRTLLGWNTTANGSGTNYAIGQTITLSTNLTLYAQWQVNTEGPATGDRFNPLIGTLLILSLLAIAITRKPKKTE